MTVSRSLLLAITPLYVLSASAQVTPPEKALKYHEVLLKRPQNAALFDRFYGAWIDEQPVETLGSFLLARAEANGGAEWGVLARYQIRRGQEEKALDSLEKAIAGVPEDPSLPMDRAKILLKRMEFGKARADLAQVAAGKDEALALEAAKMIGKSWLREGKTEEAIKAWDAMLASHPGDEDLLEDLVESAASDGETGQALAYLSKLIDSSTDPYKKTLRSIRRGDLLVQAGKADEAVAAYSATLVVVGEGSWLEQQVLAQIDKTFRKQDRLSDLTAELKKLAEANPRRIFIHRQLAKLEASQGDIDSAIGRFREVLQRSPGDRELREEFVRLLTDAERFDDAAAELEKMIAQAPAEAELQLQLAALRSRQGKGEAVMAALKKARELMGTDEANGIRIAGLMIQYGQNEAGETLLKELAAAPNAGPTPAEVLAAEYGRTKRKPEALELLKKVASSTDEEVILRAATAISVLGENELAYQILAAHVEKFPVDPRYLSALAQAAMAAGKPLEGIAPAVKLVRLSTQSAELAENLSLASRIIVAADKVTEWRTTLEGQESRTPAEVCLLAELLELQGDQPALEKLVAGNQDSLVVHFYAALLDRRGDFDLAIAEFSRLADTEEGRKAEYFKDLSELQQRAGKMEEALATVERWKQSAPGDKTAWTTGSRLLRTMGKLDEAIKATRQAVSRFEDDVDLAAGLASLHEQAGETAEAEAIYWRLYNASESPADQARWAAPLATLAAYTGRTSELEEQFQARASGNRKSVGPLLAQVELARVMDNEDKRRALLFEALRLQPDNVDLRLQIANLEEHKANLEGSVAILEEALAKDTTGRIRAALAQAYLRQGKVLKGMRELQALAGKQAKDPRALEDSAASLAAAGMYEEAISFLREMLPENAHWRSRYLLAVMLEQDGREAEAIPLFLSLLKADGEDIVKQLTPQQQQQEVAFYENLTPEMRKWTTLLISSKQAYVHQDSNRRGGMYWSGASMISLSGPFALPEKAEVVRALALTHLAKLSKKTESGTALLDQLRSNGVENVDFVADLLSLDESFSGIARLLDKYPGQPSLLELALRFSGFRETSGFTAEIAKKALAARKTVPPDIVFQTWLRVVMNSKADDASWDQLFAAIPAAMASKEKNAAVGVMSNLLYVLSQTKDSITEANQEKLKALLKQQLDTELPDREVDLSYRLGVSSTLADYPAWIKAMNAFAVQLRKTPDLNGYRMSQWSRAKIFQYIRYGSSGSYNYWAEGDGPFELPTLGMLSFNSISWQILMQLKPKEGEGMNVGNSFAVEAKELKNLLDQVESPALRAWMALNIGEEPLITKALALTPPPEEAADFALLKAYHSINQKKYADAYQLLEQTRSPRASDQDYQLWLNFTQVAVATEMTPAEREGIRESLSTTLYQCRQKAGIKGAPAIAEKAKQLGLEDLAKRLMPPVVASVAGNKTMGPAGFTSGSGSSRSSGSSGSMDRYSKLVDEKKYEAAAAEALLLLRAARTNPNQGSYQVRNLMSNISGDVIPELIKLAHPGDSKSLTKRLEYVDLCISLGKAELALASLKELAKERPDDISISARLVFALPADQRDRALQLLTRSAQSEDFIGLFGDRASLSRRQSDVKPIIDLYAIVAQWLETTPPQSLASTNLTWVGYYSKEFYDNLSGMPALLRGYDRNGADPKLIEQRNAVAKQLALAMLKHAQVSEEGFRLLSASSAWKLPEEEMDAHARAAVLNGRNTEPAENSYYTYFILKTGNGTNSSGEDLKGNASVAWLARRLAKAKSPADILPPAYLAELTRKSPPCGGLLSQMAELSSVKQLDSFWKTPEPKGASPVEIMLRQGMLERGGSLPGADKFFIAVLKETKIGENRQSNDPRLDLMRAALNAGLQGKPEELDAICAAISACILGNYKSWEEVAAKNQNSYQTVAWMDNLTNVLAMDAPDTVRVMNALHRQKVPVGSGTYRATQFAEKTQFQNAEEVVAFLKTLGWLDDVATWEPYAAYEMDSNGNRAEAPKEKLIIGDTVSNLNMKNSRSDVVKLLKERKPATFGALMTAAAMESGRERSDLAAAAFTAAAPELAKMPAARLDKFELILPWVPSEVSSTLPRSLREKFTAIETERNKELVKAADDYLAKKEDTRNSSDNVFRIAYDIIDPLAAKDMEKATAVFLEAERRFSERVLKGSSLSSYTSDGVQIIYRDTSLMDLVDDSDSLGGDPAVMLRFVDHVLKSPQGSRFSYGYSSKGYPVLAAIGYRCLQRRSGDSKNPLPTWAQAVDKVRAYPEGLRQQAYAAIVLGYFYENSAFSARELETERKKTKDAGDAYKEFLPYREISCGILGWKADQPEGRATTIKALDSVLADESLSEPTRMQLALTTLYRAPGLLENPGIAEKLTAWYERYCEGERTAVNPLSLGVMDSLANPPTPEVMPFAKRINEAFWKNANAAKAGGHSQIAPSTALTLYLAANNLQDEAQSKKLFAILRQTYIGHLPSIVRLIASRKFDDAQALLRDPAQIYLSKEALPAYSTELEKGLAEFGKSGVDPLQLLRVECQLLRSRNEKSKEPAEALPARKLRLAEAFKKAPPAERLIQLETLAAICESHPASAVALRDPLKAMAATIDYKEAIRLFVTASERNKDKNPRYAIAELECHVIRHAAMADLLQGDPAAFMAMAKILAESDARNPDNSSTYSVGRIYRTLMEDSALWLYQAVATGRMDGFLKTRKSYEDLILKGDDNSTVRKSDIRLCLKIHQLLSAWDGHPEEYTALLQNVKTAETNKDMADPDGFGMLIGSVSQRSPWNEPSFAEIRSGFLQVVFSRPQLAPLFPNHERWVDTIAKGDLAKDLETLGNPLPENFLPQVRTPLLMYQSGRLLEDKKRAEALAASQAAVDACPVSPEANDLRTSARCELAGVLLANDQKEKARTVFAAIKPEEVTAPVKKSYDAMAKKLAEKPKS